MSELVFELLDANDELGALGLAAADELFNEDHQLADAMKHREGEHGLTYPLYETTLVYLVFRRWVRTHDVALDYAQLGKRETTDLLIRGTEDWAFEAKWWLSSKGQRKFENDVDRLRRWRLDPSSTARRAFTMAFWWTTAERELSDIEAANRWYDSEPRTPLRVRAHWPTSKERIFYFEMAEVF